MKRITIPRFAVVFCLIVIGHGLGREEAGAQTTAEVRERVDTIIKETLRRSEFTIAGNVKVITRVPPSYEAVEEIKRYGDRAILPLQEHLSSENAFEYELAMRLLGALGGERIIEPLKKIIVFDESARKREYALRWITQAPWDQASRVITQAAENDPDVNVRKVAKELLSGYAPSSVK
jgi:hypothetical protein